MCVCMDGYGRNIYVWSIVTCIYIGVSTLLIVQGPTRKSFAAMIGCLTGTAISGILTVIMSKILFGHKRQRLYYPIHFKYLK